MSTIIEAKPGDPYPFENKTNPYLHFLEKWTNVPDEEEKMSVVRSGGF